MGKDKDGYTDDPADQLMKKNADAKTAVRKKAANAFSAGMGEYARSAQRDAVDMLRPASAEPTSGGSSVPALNLPSFKRGGTMKRSGMARLHRGEKAASRKSKGR